MTQIKKYLSSENIKYLSIIALLSLIGYAILFFFFGKSSFKTENKNEIVITYADNISPAHLHLINKFNAQNKGKIRVEPINLPFTKFSTNERKELLARSLRSKSKKLDVFAIDLIWSARFAKWSEPLNEYISAIDTSDIIPQALESCFYKDTLVALPIYLDIGMMYYRKDLIKELPNHIKIESMIERGITWKELFNLRDKFNLSENQYYIFPADNYEGLMCSYFEILYHYSKSDPKEISNIKNITNQETFEFINNLIHSEKMSPIAISDFNENNCYEYFIENDGVFLRGWPSSEKDYKDLMQIDDVDSILGKAALPHFEGDKQRSVLGGWNLMISKYSEHKNAAFKFLQFVLKEGSQKELFEIGYYMPVVKSIYNDEKFLKKYPNLIYNKSLLKSGVHRPVIEDYTRISDIISNYLNQSIKEEVSIEEALKKSNEAIKSGKIIVR